jgi:hypothetical protein
MAPRKNVLIETGHFAHDARGKNRDNYRIVELRCSLPLREFATA